MFAKQSIHFDTNEWRRKTSEQLRDCYSEASWNMIFSAIDTDEQLDALLRDCPDIISCYTLYSHNVFTGTFVCLIREDINTNRLSIHGGAITDSVKDKLLITKAYIEMILEVLKEGYSLETSCAESNSAARKLNTGVGFKQLRSENGRVYYQVNYSDVINSRLYAYFFK